MYKIKIVTDSGSDLDFAKARELGIKIFSFPIAVDNTTYKQSETFTPDDFYKVMDDSTGFPVTSQITFVEFGEAYKKYYEKKYTDIIYISISSTGSNTYNNALMARTEFYTEFPEAEKNFRIHIVDSKNYTGSYGYPTMEAALKAQKGITPDEIVAYLEEWFECVEMYFAPYSLEYVRRSGRLSAAAAFAGELLGLRPIIKMCDGASFVPEKVRGDKNIIPKLLQVAEKQMIPHTPYCILEGSLPEAAEEITKEMTKKFGYPPECTFKIGATIGSHAGHKVVGFVIRGQKRK